MRPRAKPGRIAAGDAGNPLRLAAVVVTFNRLAALRQTLPRILEQPVDHVIVVDNGSTDGTRDWLASLTRPNLTVVLAQENRGGAGGFEMGLRTAVERFDPDWCVLLDDDAYPAPDAITRFRALNLSGLDAVAAAVRLPSGQISEFNRPWHAPFGRIRVMVRLWRGRGGFHIPDTAFAASGQILAIDGASFVGFFVSRSAVERAGYPDGRLFIYGDDVLYSLGLKARGCRMGFSPDVGFVHDCSISDPRIVHRPLWKTYYLYRNRWHIYRSAAGPVLFWPIMSAMAASWFVKALRLAPRDRSAYLRLTRLALADAMRGSFDRKHADILTTSRDLSRG